MIKIYVINKKGSENSDSNFHTKVRFSLNQRTASCHQILYEFICKD